MIETETIGRPANPEVQTTLQKVNQFALNDERFRNLRGDLHSIAVQKAAFFLDAPEEVVHQRVRLLYKKELAEKALNEMRPSMSDDQYVAQLGNIYGRLGYNSFDRREKEDLGDGFYEMYDHYLDSRLADTEGGFSEEDADRGWKRDLRIEIARREARIEFASALNYMPGDKQKDAYDGTASNQDFVTANDLVTEAMQKFI